MDLDLSERGRREKIADPSPQKEACFEVRTHRTLQECPELVILLNLGTAGMRCHAYLFPPLIIQIKRLKLFSSSL